MSILLSIGFAFLIFALIFAIINVMTAKGFNMTSDLQKETPWKLIEVKGSSSHLSNIQTTGQYVQENCHVKIVQLGFVLDGCTSRWLTHKEISNGVIQAIKSENNKTIVGTLEPWDRRP